MSSPGTDHILPPSTSIYILRLRKQENRVWRCKKRVKKKDQSLLNR